LNSQPLGQSGSNTMLRNSISAANSSNNDKKNA